MGSQKKQPIFHCLKSLNDLVRLAKALDVDFPFSAYAAIEHIPVIEVEFVHLAGLESYPGQLTLLDTPGPNEAGQPHLQKMLNQQLARASAVLAVLDYTQLKSISDEEVREAILAVGQCIFWLAFCRSWFSAASVARAAPSRPAFLPAR